MPCRFIPLGMIVHGDDTCGNGPVNVWHNIPN